MSWGAVILAAGQGKRLRTSLAKVLHQACGKPLVDWVLAAVQPLAPAKTVVVVGHLREQVAQHLAGAPVVLVVQDPPRGTGDAFRVALPALSGCRRALVLPGDAPLLSTASLAALCRLQHETGAACALATAVLPEGGAYGRVLRQEGRVVAIVEARDATPEQLAVREVNAGVYVFDLAAVTPYLAQLSTENSQGEYYITDLVAALVAAGKPVVALPLADPQEMLGVNTREELAQVSRILNQRVVRFWQENGVTVIHPETTWIEEGCQLGPDTVLEPGVVVRGASVLGARCRVGAWSVLERVRLGDDTQVPPLSYLRGS
jgi:bifunctional UDP-N-acetylglucosamine pyrophosphorylase/glucosamine-1-phosphate N-acetyltransferase